MSGPEDDRGVNTRALDELFQRTKARKDEYTDQIAVSVLEVSEQCPHNVFHKQGYSHTSVMKDCCNDEGRHTLMTSSFDAPPPVPNNTAGVQRRDSGSIGPSWHGWGWLPWWRVPWWWWYQSKQQRREAGSATRTRRCACAWIDR